LGTKDHLYPPTEATRESALSARARSRRSNPSILREVRPKCKLREIFLTCVQPHRTLTAPDSARWYASVFINSGLFCHAMGLTLSGTPAPLVCWSKVYRSRRSQTTSAMCLWPSLRCMPRSICPDWAQWAIFHSVVWALLPSTAKSRHADPDARKHRSPARRGRDQPGRSPMILSQAVEQYILHKRSRGIGFRG